MWKRLPLRDRGKENHVQISAPTLVDSSYDPGQLEHAADIRGPAYEDYEPTARPPTSRQNTDQSVLPPIELYVLSNAISRRCSDQTQLQNTY
jgi:hypothetical protein